MATDVDIWLECLASLHKSQMRKAASASGQQLVHLEILRYLSICNRYSNTAKDVSDYLGQTKGSISQSLRVMEEAGYIERAPCKKDGRVTRLFLTDKGRGNLMQMADRFVPQIPQTEPALTSLRNLFQAWQGRKDLKGFGQCKSCRHNMRVGKDVFHCRLLDEALSAADVLKICKEHAFDQA